MEQCYENVGDDKNVLVCMEHVSEHIQIYEYQSHACSHCPRDLQFKIFKNFKENLF